MGVAEVLFVRLAILFGGHKPVSGRSTPDYFAHGSLHNAPSCRSRSLSAADISSNESGSGGVPENDESALANLPEEITCPRR